MAKPLLSADAIYDEALRALAAEGPAGLMARNLSARLRCSTKTLYRQVGNREELIRGVVSRAFASIELDFSTDTSWQDSVRSWCQALRGALVQRPSLTSLMTVADSDVVITYVTRLIRVLKQYGFTEKEAVDACNVLVHVALSLTVTDMAVHEDTPEIFDTTINWLIQGMELSHKGIGSAQSRRPRTRPSTRH
ncbi:TetR/AcrR family transcriptional regulator [Mycobacterium sp. DL440]|uniref:TetR/AcrR family transcriptional regulator n=1 Tax=Mycobacterium sp. DL440 TaxID=2675523 RepID=UPI001420D80A|nr:TetR/AcrR family transcriptional regulator C-terminal domain-containing protein [Mycobacterium sp. DL440]